MPVAVITGASRGLGHALSSALADRGWRLVVDARDAGALDRAVAAFHGGPHHAIAGDVTDADHREVLADAAAELGGADLLVNNASTLGASPLPSFAELSPATYADVLAVNVVAPMAMAAMLLPQLRARGGRVIAMSSDATVEPYENLGAYGSSKAALDHATRILAAEERLKVYTIDPGDMRTDMQQAAFPRRHPDQAAAGDRRTRPATARREVVAVRPLSHGRATGRGDPGMSARASESAERFLLPDASEATAPPEERGLARDGVRLAVATPAGTRHTAVRDLPDLPPSRRPGGGERQRDPAAAVDFTRHGCPGGSARLHAARRRRLGGGGSTGRPGRTGHRRAGRGAAPSRRDPAAAARGAPRGPAPAVAGDRPAGTEHVDYIKAHGRPIRYPYLDDAWPLDVHPERVRRPAR